MPARREQVNVPIDERWVLVAKQAAQAEGCSVPELLRPVLERYLSELMDSDADIRDSVLALERARQRRRGAPVTELRVTPPSAASGDENAGDPR